MRKHTVYIVKAGVKIQNTKTKTIKMGKYIQWGGYSVV